MNNEIGIKIKKTRKEKKISQIELAKKIKSLNQSQLCKIENGNRYIRVKELSQIANALNVPLHQLIS